MAKQVMESLDYAVFLTKEDYQLIEAVRTKSLDDATSEFERHFGKPVEIQEETAIDYFGWLDAKVSTIMTATKKTTGPINILDAYLVYTNDALLDIIFHGKKKEAEKKEFKEEAMKSFDKMERHMRQIYTNEMNTLALALYTVHSKSTTPIPKPAILQEKKHELSTPRWKDLLNKYTGGVYASFKALIKEAFIQINFHEVVLPDAHVTVKTIVLDESRAKGSLPANPDEEEKVPKSRLDLHVGGQQSYYPRPAGAESYLMPQDVLVNPNHNMKDYIGKVTDLDKRPQLLNPAAVAFTEKELAEARLEIKRLIKLNGGYLPLQEDIELYLDHPAYFEAYCEASLSKQFMTLTRNPFELCEQAYFTLYFKYEKLYMEIKHARAMSIKNPNEPNYQKIIENLEKAIKTCKEDLEAKLLKYSIELNKKIPIVYWQKQYAEAKQILIQDSHFVHDPSEALIEKVRQAKIACELIMMAGATYSFYIPEWQEAYKTKVIPEGLSSICNEHKKDLEISNLYMNKGPNVSNKNKNSGKGNQNQNASQNNQTNQANDTQIPAQTNVAQTKPKKKKNKKAKQNQNQNNQTNQVMQINQTPSQPQSNSNEKPQGTGKAKVFPKKGKGKAKWDSATFGDNQTTQAPKNNKNKLAYNNSQYSSSENVSDNSHYEFDNSINSQTQRANGRPSRSQPNVQLGRETSQETQISAQGQVQSSIVPTNAKELYASLSLDMQEQLKVHFDKLIDTARPQLNVNSWVDNLNLSSYIHRMIETGIDGDEDELIINEAEEARLQCNIPVDLMQQYDLQPVERLAAELTILHYVDTGIIQEINNKKVRAQGKIFLRGKPDGAYRLIYDMRPFNVNAPPPDFAMPNPFACITETLPWFIKIDLTNAFYHFKLNDEYSNNFCFAYGNKLYKWNVLPFGFSRGPFFCTKLFRPLWDKMRSDFPSCKMVVYMDDICITAPTKDMAAQFGSYFMKTCLEYGVLVNANKCILKPCNQIEFLGREITCTSVKNREASIEKLKTAYSTFKVERTVGNWLSLLGQISYLSFIHVGLRGRNSYLHSLCPQALRIRRKLHAREFRINDDDLELVSFMIDAISINKPWTFMRYEQTYQIFTDASKFGFGFAGRSKNSENQIMKSAYIPVKWRIDRSISEANLNIYPMYLLELMAIYIAIKASPFSCNLIIYTDSEIAQKSLKRGILKVGDEFAEAQDIFDKIMGLMNSKQISLILRRVSSEDNPADEPSRELAERLEFCDECFTSIPASSFTFEELRNQMTAFKAPITADWKQQLLNDLNSKTHAIDTFRRNLKKITELSSALIDDKYTKIIARAIIMTVLKGDTLPREAKTIVAALVSKGALPCKLHYDALTDLHQMYEFANNVVNKVQIMDPDSAFEFSFINGHWAKLSHVWTKPLKTKAMRNPKVKQRMEELEYQYDTEETRASSEEQTSDFESPSNFTIGKWLKEKAHSRETTAEETYIVPAQEEQLISEYERFEEELSYDEPEEETRQIIRSFKLKKPEVKPNIISSTDDDQPPSPPKQNFKDTQRRHRGLRMLDDDDDVPAISNNRDDRPDNNGNRNPENLEESKNNKNSNNKDGGLEFEKCNKNNNNDDHKPDEGQGGATKNATLALSSKPFVPHQEIVNCDMPDLEPLELNIKNSNEDEAKKFMESLAQQLAEGLTLQMSQLQVQQQQAIYSIQDQLANNLQVKTDYDSQLIENAVKDMDSKIETLEITLNSRFEKRLVKCEEGILEIIDRFDSIEVVNRELKGRLDNLKIDDNDIKFIIAQNISAADFADAREFETLKKAVQEMSLIVDGEVVMMKKEVNTRIERVQRSVEDLTETSKKTFLQIESQHQQVEDKLKQQKTQRDQKIQESINEHVNDLKKRIASLNIKNDEAIVKVEAQIHDVKKAIEQFKSLKPQIPLDLEPLKKQVHNLSDGHDAMAKTIDMLCDNDRKIEAAVIERVGDLHKAAKYSDDQITKIEEDVKMLQASLKGIGDEYLVRMEELKETLLRNPAVKAWLEGIETPAAEFRAMEPEIPLLNAIEEKLPDVNVELETPIPEFIATIGMFDKLEQSIQIALAEAAERLATPDHVIDFQEIWYCAGAMRATLKPVKNAVAKCGIELRNSDYFIIGILLSTNGPSFHDILKEVLRSAESAAHLFKFIDVALEGTEVCKIFGTIMQMSAKAMKAGVPLDQLKYRVHKETYDLDKEQAVQQTHEMGSERKQTLICKCVDLLYDRLSAKNSIDAADVKEAQKLFNKETTKGYETNSITKELATTMCVRAVAQAKFFAQYKQKVMYEGAFGETNFQNMLEKCQIQDDPGDTKPTRLFGSSLTSLWSNTPQEETKRTALPTGDYTGDAFKKYRDKQKTTETQYTAFKDIANSAWKENENFQATKLQDNSRSTGLLKPPSAQFQNQIWKN